MTTKAVPLEDGSSEKRKYPVTPAARLTVPADSNDDDERPLIQYKYRRHNGECQKCPENVILIVCIFVTGLFVCGTGGYILNAKKVNLGIFQIGIDYFQVLAMMSAIDVEWPNKQ